MIEVLVSDLGQVVLPFDFSPTKAFLRQRSRKVSSDVALEPWSVLSELHDSMGFGAGHCPSEEFYRQVKEQLDLDATYPEFCTAWSDVFSEDLEVVELIRRTRVKKKLLLSNTNAIHWEWILEKHADALSVFDRLLASQELGLLKPHREIFYRVQEISGYPAEAHLLIDDIQENIDGARSCGWDGIVHTDAASLERELRVRGLL